jgi:tryptophan synthase alpha chain
MTGITGTQAIKTGEVRRLVETLRARCRLPIGVGFGITTPMEAAEVASYADAAVVGSAIVRLIEKNDGQTDTAEEVGAFIRSLKDAMRSVPHAAGHP